jgi:hypothetical protein
MTPNGESEKVKLPAGTPVIAVVWDEKEQGVNLQFDPLLLRSWDFVVGLLEMAKNKADAIRRMQYAQQTQQQHAEQQQAEALRRQLRLGH